MNNLFIPDRVYGPGAGHANEYIPPNPEPYGQCTYFCWEYLWKVYGYQLPSMGNATDWPVEITSRGLGHLVSVPQEGDIACWSGDVFPPDGHVAIVVGVGSDGSYTVMEMNFVYDEDINPDNAGLVDEREVASNRALFIRIENLGENDMPFAFPVEVPANTFVPVTIPMPNGTSGIKFGDVWVSFSTDFQDAEIRAAVYNAQSNTWRALNDPAYYISVPVNGERPAFKLQPGDSKLSLRNEQNQPIGALIEVDKF